MPHDGQQCDQRHQQRETLGRPQAAADFHVHGQEGQARQDETDRRGRRNAVGVHGIGAEVAAKEDLVDAQSPAEEHVAELDESHQGDEGGDHLGKDPQASIVHGCHRAKDRPERRKPTAVAGFMDTEWGIARLRPSMAKPSPEAPGNRREHQPGGDR